MSPTFLEGVPKLLAIFFPPFSRELDFLSSDILGSLHSFLHVFNHLTTSLAALLWDLTDPSVPCDDRGSGISGGTSSLRPRKFTPCLLFYLSHDVEGLDSLISFSPTGFLVHPYFFVLCE